MVWVFPIKSAQWAFFFPSSLKDEEEKRLCVYLIYFLFMPLANIPKWTKLMFDMSKDTIILVNIVSWDLVIGSIYPKSQKKKKDLVILIFPCVSVT
jgi:hypothetical protein